MVELIRRSPSPTLVRLDDLHAITSGLTAAYRRRMWRRGGLRRSQRDDRRSVRRRAAGRRIWATAPTRSRGAGGGELRCTRAVDHGQAASSLGRQAGDAARHAAHIRACSLPPGGGVKRSERQLACLRPQGAPLGRHQSSRRPGCTTVGSASLHRYAPIEGVSTPFHHVRDLLAIRIGGVALRLARAAIDALRCRGQDRGHRRPLAQRRRRRKGWRKPGTLPSSAPGCRGDRRRLGPGAAFQDHNDQHRRDLRLAPTCGTLLRPGGSISLIRAGRHGTSV